MARSSSEPGAPRRARLTIGGMPPVVLLDRVALGGIALGFLLAFQPWGGTLRAGFFVTLVATVLHVVTSHLTTEGS